MMGISIEVEATSGQENSLAHAPAIIIMIFYNRNSIVEYIEREDEIIWKELFYHDLHVVCGLERVRD